MPHEVVLCHCWEDGMSRSGHEPILFQATGLTSVVAPLCQETPCGYSDANDCHGKEAEGADAKCSPVEVKQIILFGCCQ